MMDEGMEDDDRGDEGPGDRAQAAAAVQEPSPISVVWSFISTFFTSLIPEGRPHPAN